MIVKEYDCVADTFTRDSPHFKFPCFLENQDKEIDFYYPFQLIRIQKQNIIPIGRYECLYTNLFVTVNHLDNLYKKRTPELFKYKIKEKNFVFQPVENEDEEHEETTFSHYIDWLPEMFTFEFNVFNILSITEKACLLEKNRSNVVLFCDEKESKNGEKSAVYSLIELAREYCRKNLKIDLGKFFELISKVCTTMEAFLKHFAITDWKKV